MGLPAPRQDRMRRLLYALPLLIVIAALAFLWSLALQDRSSDVVQVCVGLRGCGDETSESVAASDNPNDGADEATGQAAESQAPDSAPAEQVDSDLADEPASNDADSSPAPNADSATATVTDSDAAAPEASPQAVPEPTTSAADPNSEDTSNAGAASAPTESPTPTATSDPAATATPRVIRPSRPSPTPVAGESAPTATVTPRRSDANPTPTRIPTPTATPRAASPPRVSTPTPTPRAIPTATRVPAVTASPTPIPSPTATAVPTAISVSTPTPVPSATATPMPAPTSTPTPVPTPAGPQPVGRPGNWNLIFEDNFDIVDRSKWETAWFSNTDFTPSVNDNGGACFHPGQVNAIGGQIEMRLDPTTNDRCRLKNGEQADYVGALINTRQTFTFSYGYAEARMFLPGSGGSLHNWPAFWHTGFDWPATGEVDIVEGLSGGQPCSVYHYEQGGVHQQNKSCVNWPDPTGWHVFAADWEPGRITFYYDGVEVFQTTQGVVGAPHYLIFDYTLRANGEGTSAPSSMLVDYVRVWTSE